MNQSPLLADPQALALESLTVKDTQVVLVVKTIQLIAPCPKCHQPSSRVHSRYGCVAMLYLLRSASDLQK